jgi:hypothetical protein
VLDDREKQIALGRDEAEHIIAAATAERARLVSRTEIVQHAREEADRLVEEGRANAEAMRREVEDYVDGKLANFEVVLTKTLSAVSRGREKLRGRDEMAELAEQAQASLGPAYARPAPISMDDTGEHTVISLDAARPAVQASSR